VYCLSSLVRDNGIGLFLSAYAEDHGLCPWMNADSVTESFLCPRVNATADSATGG
jgi:hypothetical protein